MQRATRSMPTVPPTNGQPTPVKTPAKRGRKPKQQSAPQETKQEELPPKEASPMAQDVPAASSSPQPAQEDQVADLEERVIEVGENELPVFLSSEDAHMILDVLEKIDADGLLDQPVNVAAVVFSQSTSDQHEVSSTFRSLLDQSNDVSLRHIYKAAQNFAIRMAPKSRRRSPVTERTRKFCDLLIQLLLELIRANGAVSAQRVDLEPLEDDIRDRPVNAPYYALFQQLGSAGTLFSSAAQLSKEQLAKMPLGQAEIVAVLPSQPLPISELPTFSSLVSHRTIKPRPIESLPSVKRLPYDPYASFAPAYATEASYIEEHDSVLARQASINFRRWEKQYWPSFRRLREVKNVTKSRKGRSGKSEREASKGQKRAREAEEEEGDRAKRRKLDEESSVATEEEALSIGESAEETAPIFYPEDLTALSTDGPVIDPSLLDMDLLRAANSVLAETGKLQNIDVLLRENSEALEALRTMQDTRLRKDNKLTEDSAENRLAKTIEAKLASLIEWQPRSSDAPQHPALTPDPVTLSKLEPVLPLEPVPGYKGILKPNSAALKDNTTVRISTAAPSEPATSAPTYGASTPAYATSVPSHQRYLSRQTTYNGTTAYNAGQTTPYQSIYPAQAYGTPYPGTPAYSHYAAAYGANGHTYAAASYPGYGSPAQGYAAYAGYSYGTSPATYPAASYTPTQHTAARSGQPSSSVQPWNYANQTPVAALPAHMRATTGRTSPYSTSTSQPYAAWPKV